jgi:hypothetical protein
MFKFFIRSQAWASILGNPRAAVVGERERSSVLPNPRAGVGEREMRNRGRR